MISTEYGAPKFFMENLNLEHVSGGGYGTHLNVFDWKERTLKQRIDLGAEGVMPLEIRFLHNPKKAEVSINAGWCSRRTLGCVKSYR